MIILSSLVDGWASLALALTWQLAALAALAWLCERVLKLRHPRARHGLWWFVLVAPLVLAPGRIALERREAVVRVAAPAAVERAVARVRIPATSPVHNPMAGPAAAASPVADTSWWSRVRPVDVLALAWVLGCLMLVARLAVGHARARRLVGQSHAVTDGEALGALAELCAQTGVKREVHLRVSPSGGAPVLYGLSRPTVLLPEGWVESLSPDDLRALLAHEVAHIKRRDFLANLLQRFIEVPLFFHPAAWLAGRRIMLAREELCDAAALSPHVDAKSYALSLLAAAERTQARLAVASVGVAEGKFTLLRRVEAIMRADRVNGISRVVWVVLAALVIVAAVAFAAVEVRATGGGGGRRVVAADADFMPEALHVQSNMQRLGLAMRSYLLEHAEIFPKADSVNEMLRRLGPYLAPESILVHATIGDPLEVRYVARSGAPVSPENAAEIPFAEATCAALPGLRVVAYADGHVERKRSGEGGSGGGGWALSAVLVNMEHLALAMRAYLADHNNRFPAATDGRSLVAALETYLNPRLLFTRPGTREVVVRYVMTPGTTWSNIPGREAHTVPVFVADYTPEFTVVVDAQMMARIRGTD
ncbi:MAG: M56 family metallopeptidase [Armatimonadota bacterium]|nr:MAG: M56 family metallopeptidase [Armatimonadota bacterium]